MNSLSAFKLVGSDLLFRSPVLPPPKLPQVSRSISSNFPSCSSVPYALPSLWRRKNLILVSSKSSDAEELSDAEDEDEWLRMLPDKDKPLYAHSLLCIEAWLRKLGFFQSKDDRAVWLTQKPDWHAQLSLDVTDLCIRYLKIGPGNLERDVERRFSYALSREDIENAILGGP